MTNIRRRLLFAGVAVAALGLTGCGGDTDPTNAASSSSNEHDRMVKFATCLREHGINAEISDSGKDKGALRITSKSGKATDKHKVDAAMKACRKYAPPEIRNPKPIDPDQTLKAAKCLREHGIDVADPKPGKPLEIDGKTIDDKKLKQAMDACRKKLGGEIGPVLMKKAG